MALEVRKIFQRLEVAAPTVPWVKFLPEFADRPDFFQVPDQNPIFEEIEVDCAPLQMIAIEGFRPPSRQIDLLLLRCTKGLPKRDFEAQADREIEQLDYIEEEEVLFLHFRLTTSRSVCCALVLPMLVPK